MSEESTHAVPYYCPFCGEEVLVPSDAATSAWECRGCTRVFSVRLVGLVVEV